MPQLTIAAGETEEIGTPTPTPFIDSPRKSLMLCLISGDASIGWTNTVTASGATDAGIPLTVGQVVAFDAETLRFAAPLRAFSTAGGVINYQELKQY